MTPQEREAFEAMKEALEELLQQIAKCTSKPFWIGGANHALKLADKVLRAGQDPTRYAEHIKQGAGWKEPGR